MKAIVFLIAMLFVSHCAIGQSLTNNEIDSSFPTVNAPTETFAIATVPEPPTITYYMESSANKSYSFRANSVGATEYEWHVQPESNVQQIYQRGSSEILVVFKGSGYGTHIVCRAKNSTGWSEYKVISVDITF